MTIILDPRLQLPVQNSSFELTKFCIASNRNLFTLITSISHPPHPRRAVPANLPPGAFFCPDFHFYFIFEIAHFFFL